MYDLSNEKKTIVGGILLSVFSVLAQYSLPVMSYGLILALIYGAFVFFVEREALVFNKSVLFFILWCMLSQLLIYNVTGTLNENFNTYIFMYVSLFILITLSHINVNTFYKVYYVLGVIFSIVVIYQFVLGNIFGIPQSAIRILPVATENLHYWIQDSSRVSGFFTEPQGYGSYVLPLLILLLFKRKFKSAIFISIAIMASTSSQGIIIALFIWGYYLIIYEKNGKKKFFRFIAGIIVTILLILIMSRVPALQPIINKILAINIDGYDIRLTKGFYIYFAMPLKDKITGIGFGNLREYLLDGNFHFYWMKLTRDELLGYITTISNILVSFGVIAFGLYVNIFIKNWKSATPEAKLMLIVILISSFTQTILFNAWFVFYWVVYETFDNNNNDRYFKIKFK